jgi:lambda family phage portal protein
MSRVTIQKAPPKPLKLNAFDRMLGFLSPKAGVKRMAARIQEAQAYDLAASMGYVAGRHDRKSLQEWSPIAGSPNDEYLYQAETIRARSRDLTKNSPIAAGASNTGTTHVIGTGLRLHSQIDSSYLSLGDDEVETKQRELERIWRMVKNRLDFEGDVTMTDFQAMAFRGTFESGDILAVRRRDMRAGDMIPLKVQLVEADRVSNPSNESDTDKVSGGVEADRRGVVQAYYVADRHPGDFMLGLTETKWMRVPKNGRNGVPLSRLLLDKRRPGQRRGVPALAPVIEPLKQISRLTDYELTASVVSSLFTVFVKTESPSAGGLPSSPEGTESTAVPSNAGDAFLNPGAMIDLLPGESIETANPSRPNGAYDPFFRSIVQQIGMALEVPYEVLMHLYNSSYSASRAALLDAWRFFRGRRKWLGDNLLSMVYEWVVWDAVVEGIIDLPGYLVDPMARSAWLSCRWVGDAPGAINEQDAAKAAVVRLDAGLSDRATETAEMTGRDWNSEVQPQREAEKRRLDEAEMPFGAASQSQAPQEQGAEEEEDSELRKEKEEDAA